MPADQAVPGSFEHGVANAPDKFKDADHDTLKEAAR